MSSNSNVSKNISFYQTNSSSDDIIINYDNNSMINDYENNFDLNNNIEFNNELLLKNKAIKNNRHKKKLLSNTKKLLYSDTIYPNVSIDNIQNNSFELSTSTLYECSQEKYFSN